jgi:formate-dependent nitrite reductase cytochrome c552 subunit
MLNSIEAVIESLDTITEQAISEHSPEGYFSSLYGRVTKEVRDAIHRREFEDNERMEALDVVFANRYFDAYRIVKESGNSTRSWKVAFEQNANSKLIVLQHLLLGMNAHINLDL